MAVGDDLGAVFKRKSITYFLSQCQNSTNLSFRASPVSLPRTRYGVGRDPESREIAENIRILDPGSHPAARDLAGMTNFDTILSGPGSFYCFSFIALRIFSGVIGKLLMRTPMASWMALAIEAITGPLAPSPASLAPKGPSPSGMSMEYSP